MFSLTLAFIIFINNLMQEKLPKLIYIDGKHNGHTINQNRLRKLINKKYDCVNNSLPLPDFSLHQLIATSVHNLTVLPRKKTLCQIGQRQTRTVQPNAFNKRVLIFNQNQGKENEIVDLKTCKSLLNPKVINAKKQLLLFRNKKHHNRYTQHSIDYLSEIADRNITDPLKLPKNEDFDLLPWAIQENDKQNTRYCA